MKQASSLSLFGNSARWPWLWLLLFPGGGPVLGQAIPEPGIYRVDRMADYRPTDEFYYGIRTYAAPRHSPLVAATGARYCLVAVDSSTDEHKTRLVFLPPRPLAADVARAFVGGFSSPLDSMMSVSYPWEDPHDKWAGRWPGNARFRGRSFVLYENELTKDSGAGNPPRPYRANDPGRFLTVAPRGSLLVLDQPRPYRDLLAVRPAKLFFYAAPDTARRTEAYVVAGQYVAILRETAHWYLAEYVTPAGQRRQGWLSKLEQLTWVPQQAQTPAYRFEAAYADTAAATSYSDIRPYPLVLKVIERRTGRLVQLLDLDVEEGWNACDNAVRIPD
ncbi:MAG: hypothetical protein H7Z21_05240, partial [Hymenobacter sp.]|nr:hypothetical protein [Hymenobacter sp.]